MKSKKTNVKILTIAALFSAVTACSSFGPEKEYLSTATSDNKIQLSGCDYKGYTKVVIKKAPELICSPSPAYGYPEEIFYTGDSYNNSKKCYGNTVVLNYKDSGEKIYIHKLDRLYITKGQDVKFDIIGMTTARDNEENYILIKAEKNGTVVDPGKYVKKMNSCIDNMMQGLWISSKTDEFDKKNTKERTDFLDKAAKKINENLGASYK